MGFQEKALLKFEDKLHFHTRGGGGGSQLWVKTPSKQGINKQKNMREPFEEILDIP